MKVFLQKSKELFDRIGGHAIMCLATSQENNVTARSMSVIIVERRFYFQTDRNLHKYQQITANPNVALCYNNIQIEGVCKALGHPLLAENAFLQNDIDNATKDPLTNTAL